MRIITNLTRMWLTRSPKPFRFKNEYDQPLSFSDCENLGLYVHIPFCESICNFCPYCKVPYSPELCSRYIDALLREIHLSGSRQKGRKIATSLYFGGGTPALAAGRLKEIIDTVQTYFILTDGIGIELHPDNVTALKEALSEIPFETVSMDFIFALPDQTFADLKADIDTAFQNGANHVAIYPFIDFTFTSSPVPAMSKKEKHALLDAITAYCTKREYIRTSIWTFSNDKEAGYSSMTRDTFLGFGCSAATLLKRQFKINTFSIEAYCKRIDEGKLPTSLTTRFSLRQRMVYYLFWTAYSTKISSGDFEKFFGVPLKRMYGLELQIAKLLGFITEKDGEYRLTPKGAFYFHYYENFYTLSYIDKMWSIMRKEAFPQKIEL